jgi:surface polysaccharide O-acyltransferase-like enzyme
MGAAAFAATAKRNVSLDVLRIIMSVMVIGLHTDFLGDISPVGRALTVNGLFRLAVPTFLLISGFYFREAVQRQGAGRWLLRLLTLYAVWSGLYAWFWLLDADGQLQTASRLLISVLVGYWHLWFLPCALGAAVLLLALKRLPGRALLALALALYGIGVLIQYVGSHHLSSHAALDRLASITWVHRNFLLMGFPFFCIGYLLNESRLHERLRPVTVRWVATVSVVVLLLESWLHHQLSPSPRGIDSLLALIVACPALFLVAIQSRVDGQSKNLALLAAAVYFIHALFIELLQRQTSANGLSLTLSVMALSALAAPAIVRLHRRLPFLL